MTEDSRNHMRGYGSFPEGAEPTEEIAARGDLSADQPAPRSSAYPSIPIQRTILVGARPSRPWSAPPASAHAPSGVPHAEPPAPADTYNAWQGDDPDDPRQNNDDSYDLRPSSDHEPRSAPPTEHHYPIWPATVERPEGPPPPSPGAPRPSPRPEASPTSEEQPDIAIPAPGPYFAPTRPTGDEWTPDAEEWAPETPDASQSWQAEDTSGDLNQWDPYAAHPQDAPTPVEATREPDPYGLPAPTARRIEPTPPPTPRRPRRITGLLIGLLAGLLLFGTAGWYIGRATGDTQKATEPPQRPTTTQGLFEQTQATLNQSDFANTSLAKIAQGWLPYLSTCAKTKAGADDGEKARVRCTIDGMSAFFVEYKSTAARDKARADLKTQVQEARTLTPGAAAPAVKSQGNYVEYAYRLTEGGVTRTIAGIWWDDAQTPTAAYLLAYWKDGLGERWEPMRDLWSRYA